MILTAHNESKDQPKSIFADFGKTTAIVYIDGLIEIKGEGLYPNQIKELLLIAENFKMFYENLPVVKSQQLSELRQ